MRHTIAAGCAFKLVAIAKVAGASPGVELPPRGVDGFETRIPFERQLEIWEETLRALRDPRTMFAHEHQSGTGLAVDLGSRRIYETHQWDNPPIVDFPDGILADSIRVTCDWQNDSDHALRYPHEMCFAIGWYWPAESGIFCATGGGSDTCVCRTTGASAGPGGSRVAVSVRHAASIDGAKGPLDAGAPVYCALYRTEDWAAFVPKPGAQAIYSRDALFSAGDQHLPVTLDFGDVTPGEYAVTCMMDLVGGGFMAGSGDVVNLDVPKIQTLANQTTSVDVTIDFAIP